MKTALPTAYAANAYALAQKMNAPNMINVARPAAGTESFADILSATVQHTAETGKRADALAMRQATGQPNDLVDVVTAVAESESALETLVAVRDRVIAAYEEIMRMPI